MKRAITLPGNGTGPRRAILGAGVRGWAEQRRRLEIGSFLLAVTVFSILLNLLTLTSPLFMMQVFDRVMRIRSMHALTASLAIAVVLHACQGLVLLIRRRILRRFADHLDVALGPVAFIATADAARHRTKRQGQSALNDLRSVRVFIAGRGLAAVFDVPWSPLFLILMFMLHPLLGFLSLTATTLIIVLDIAAHLNKKRLPDIGAPAKPYELAVTCPDGYARALGLSARFERLWSEARGKARSERRSAELIPDVCRITARVIKNIQFTALLAVAAYLTLEHVATVGIMMASSVIASRISSPIDGLIGAWTEIVDAKMAWPRLKRAVVDAVGEAYGSRLEEELPHQQIEAVNLAGGPPQSRHPAFSSVSFLLKSGEMLAVTGSSGTGKSALARSLACEWPFKHGQLMFDGLDCSRWDGERRASLIGYLPQGVRLFDGTVASNIAGFDLDYNEAAVVAAATSVDAHDHIRRLKDGYATRITDGGAALPRGLLQRIGLARALFGAPFFLVLDDPTAWLDPSGVRRVIGVVKAHLDRGAICVVMTSHPEFLSLASRVQILANVEAVSAIARVRGRSTMAAAAAGLQPQERGRDVDTGS